MSEKNTDVIKFIRDRKTINSLSFSAIDGSFLTEEYIDSRICYITVGIVRGRVVENTFEINKVAYDVNVMECSSEDEEMTKMEYKQMTNETSDIIFMDRKLSFDIKRGIVPSNKVVGIVKDFRTSVFFQNDRIYLSNIANAPWITSQTTYEGIKTGFFRLTDITWVFMYQNMTDLEPSQLLYLLSVLGNEPVPEALGYNYPLFLADKIAKYYLKEGKAILKRENDKIRYRDFRSAVEVQRLVRARNWEA
ncbi:hypothetical protein HS7_20050 [Sulfolobales archaeon HS-7]|nr:hypothetical protein HS7_20050 [Sulfolobales archaeon HS-7]